MTTNRAYCRDVICSNSSINNHATRGSNSATTCQTRARKGRRPVRPFLEVCP
jgi:hypothetical protein